MALAPFFWLVTAHIARNQSVSGLRVSWKIVPAVTELWYPQPANCSRILRTGQLFRPPHRGYRKPSGQRSFTRYSRQDVSVEKRASNSPLFRGETSMKRHTT